MRIKPSPVFLMMTLLSLSAGSYSQDLPFGVQPGPEPELHSILEAGGVSGVNYTGDHSNVSLVHRYPYGRCRTSYLQGSYLYVANGSMLQIYDVSSASNPMLGGQVMVSEPIMAIASSATIIYAATESYINVVNVSDPHNPQLVNVYDTNIINRGYGLFDMAVDSEYLYVAAGQYGLYIFSISDRINPQYVSAHNTPGYAYGVAVSGNTVYVADSREGVRIIDVSVKTNPSEVASAAVTGYSQKLAFYGNYLLVAAQTGGMTAIDITKPSNPSIVSTFSTGGAAYDVSVSGNYACIADYLQGLRLIDITDISNPSETGYYDTDSYALDVVSTATNVFLSDSDGGLLIFSVTTPTHPKLLKAIPVAGRLWDVAVRNNFAYVIGINGFRILEIGDDFFPEETAVMDLGYVKGVDVVGNNVYVAASGALHIVDVRNPSAPIEVGTVTTDPDVTGVFVQNDYAWVTTGTYGLAIIDVSTPSAPVVRGTYDTPGSALDVVVSGNYAYVADMNEGVQIINVTDKTAPVLAGQLTTKDVALSVDIEGDLLYVAYHGKDYNGCTVYDISDPYAPQEVSDFNPTGWEFRLDVDQGYVYLACEHSGLNFYNVTDPANPVLAGFYDTANRAIAVKVDGNKAYVCDEEGGLYVLQEAIPPDAPRSLRANGSNPSPWQNSKNFTLSWQNPPDPSGISGGKYKLDNPPTGNDDYTGTLGPNPPGYVQVDQEGVHKLYMWLADGGNAESYLNTATVDLRYDKTILPPTGFAESHSVKNNEWQNFSYKATFSWRNPADLSGIMEYRVYFGTDPAGTTVDKATHTPSYMANAFEGRNYLRVEVEDSADNVLPWETYFIFKYDTTSPQNASSVNEDHSLPNDQWQNSSADPAFSWTGQYDGLSGIQNYKVYFGPSPGGIPVIVRTENSYDPPPSPNSVRYLRVQTADSAGNSSEPATLFTFRHDGTPPENPSMVTDISEAGSQNDVWQNINDDPNFSWAEDPGSDSLSGIKEYYYYWGDNPDGTSATNSLTSPFFNPAFVDTGAWYLRLKTVDNVENSAPWATVYAFKYDNVPPVVTASPLPEKTASQHIEVSWSGGRDRGGSGLSGRYDIQLKTDDGPWTPWRTNYEGTALDTTGSHNQIFHFEVAGRDNAGNVEPFSNVAEAFTQIDTTIKDEEAPGKPENLKANGDNPSPWYNQPGFELTWNNPADASGISASYYKLNTPPANAGDYTVKGSAMPPLNATASNEGGQFLYLWLEDGQGNNGYMNCDSIMLRMDQTKPEGTVAHSRTLTDSLSFTVSWSGSSDQGGSGLSGKYYIEYKMDAGAWEPYLDAYEGTALLFEDGSHGHTYYFAIASYDRAGNREEFTPANTCSTAVDTTAEIDRTPPDLPGNLTAMPAGWTHNNDFSVQWDNPPGDASISGAYYKLGAPGGPQDGIFISGNITKIDHIAVPVEGSHALYVWLRDTIGNVSHLNVASVTLFLDQNLPELQHTPATGAQQIHADITINASASDGLSGIKQLRLSYRKTGDVSNPSTTDFSSFNVGSAIIPASENTQRGVEYAITAEDSAGNIRRIPETGFHSVRLQLSDTDGVQRDNSGKPVAFHSGNRVNDYRMFSIPVNLENKRPVAILEDDLGPYDNKVWRFFDISDETLIEYNSFSNQPVVTPGKAFLLIVSPSGKYIYSGPGEIPRFEDFRDIPLTMGFNLVGNPFDFDIPVANLEVVNTTTGPFWYLGTNGWISNPTVFRKWEGFAIEAGGNGYLRINLEGSGASGQPDLSNCFRSNDWGIRIKASGGISKDLDNYVGVYTEKPETGTVRWKEPPRLAGSVGLSIVQEPAVRKSGGAPEVEHLAMLMKENNEYGYTWELSLAGEDSRKDVQLDVEVFGELPDEFDCCLVDPMYHMAYDLREMTSMTCKADDAGSRTLKLIAGNADYVKANSGGISLNPETFELRQNFPNPFNPDTWIIFTLPEESEVTLDIYNILGQKIRTLYGNRVLKTGYQMVHWDGMNQTGKAVASGVYVIRLQAGREVRLRKAILAR